MLSIVLSLDNYICLYCLFFLVHIYYLVVHCQVCFILYGKARIITVAFEVVNPLLGLSSYYLAFIADRDVM